ncbi:hypothetical protein HTZ97_07270 [Desulfuromonas acetoxidans]|uniref:DUF2399 domain-containing protein n=1 Tax=Desulfuromonas acetoxidans (strain DSM 684 / 11070) TaxID=281689 RepID=Q1K3L5_DESA6|nr:hypothetical protein [Desulfuromonas acetoxidans]EAT16959.1 conserved hypothetical protein [Desulfuromonas acetoxidans DSM 684]MBF0644510.1 hypothetical protein [Desulfuromonas acetoxidans]NVD23963.1 hypothetical protein [Desulfuromonas acetoxidans]NVE16260.1 hypothetical protein [Desulfuromonas acetoxidans]
MTIDPKIIVTTEGVGERSTLKGKRFCRPSFTPPTDFGHLAEDQRDMIRSWVKDITPRKKWSTIRKKAGFTGTLLAEDLISLLLNHGWLETEEKRTSQGWEKTWITFLYYEDLREKLGLVNRTTLQEQADNLEGEFRPILLCAADHLTAFGPETRLKRHGLLCSLDKWITEKRFGTKRDFSLFARGTTKAITSSEWDWLESNIDFEEVGISGHTPLLYIKLPSVVSTEEGALDLRLLPGQIGLTQQQILTITKINNPISCWRFVENLTSFERVVKNSASEEGIVWLPGFAPSWWQICIKHLLQLSATPVFIASDPDPAGLHIASQVGSLCAELGVDWSPWKMDPSFFSESSSLSMLTVHDKNLLRSFIASEHRHPDLLILADWIEKNGLKGEQELFL